MNDDNKSSSIIGDEEVEEEDDDKSGLEDDDDGADVNVDDSTAETVATTKQCGCCDLMSPTIDATSIIPP